MPTVTMPLLLLQAHAKKSQAEQVPRSAARCDASRAHEDVCAIMRRENSRRRATPSGTSHGSGGEPVLTYARSWSHVVWCLESLQQSPIILGAFYHRLRRKFDVGEVDCTVIAWFTYPLPASQETEQRSMSRRTNSPSMPRVLRIPT